ncbi:4'-phosphopantetheinyl transferase superfamily protein [Caballeronia sp. SEWSISQ10-4 2]|uniref:4'-phosphopantetheinyl transferase family protein n=1 Tax=Caballeronia sp. SEWSISQ10-4 2 TaxID=2937438 RepID=UPI0026540378|nr:4'-phosphopantetheinyl transferase superfamily protein [Caballeronia sp. SEWSISQ10-4 2]MDN7183618.1 4'-phosphopantetheinyl transferase superfamily protein [Caballeronia sp. SEWSISQ10-4 2]
MDERLRAARFMRNQDRFRFAATRAALRALLSKRTGKPEDTLRFSLGQYGKPVLDGHPQISFNVTHSGQHALIAVSDSRRVGVDVEVIDPSIRWRELLDLVCSGVEQQTVVSSSKDSQPQLFFRCWTAKEALLKAAGVGLTEGLCGITLDLLSPGGQWRCDQPNEDLGTFLFQFHWLSEIPDCIGCVAFEKSTSQVHDGVSGDGSYL